MSCYTGFFNVRRGWQSLNTGPQFYLRLIRRTGWLWIYTSRTTDGRPFKPKKLSVPILYPRVDPFQRTSASRAEKPGAYFNPATTSGRGVIVLEFTSEFRVYNMLQHYLNLGTTQGSFQQSLVEIGSVVSEKIKKIISSPLFYIFSLAAMLVGSWDHRTHFSRGATQGPFHQSLVAIGPVVFEEKIKMWNVDRRTMDEKWWQS